MGRDKSREPEKILIVDDLEINVEILKNIIEAEGYETLCALNVTEALEIMNREMPQLVLSDYSMPDMNGVEFCRLLKTNPKTREIPFILITVADSSEVKKTAFEAGAVDYIPKPFERMEVVMRIGNHLSSFRARKEIEEHNRRMHRVIEEQKALMEQEQEKLLTTLSKVVEKRNHEMGEHSERVGYNCRVLAQSLQLTDTFESQISDEFVEIIYAAAKLHDIGTLVIPDELVEHERIGRMSGDTEYVVRHTTEGADFLEEIGANGTKSQFLAMATEIARYHHTHWDGTGYPKVSGNEIPLSARIAAVANDFELELQRSGGETAAEDVINAICEKAGTVYDPEMIRVFAKVAKKFKVPGGI